MSEYDEADLPQDLESAARHELVELWTDLERAKQSAVNGRWSMQCDNIVFRITMFTKLVGPMSWGDAPTTLLTDGTYERVHQEMGVAYEPIDWTSLRSLGPLNS